MKAGTVNDLAGQSGEGILKEYCDCQDAQRSRDLFLALHRRYAEPIRLHVLRILENDADTDEVVNDVFLTLHRKGKTFRADSSLQTWLTTVAHNSAIGALRKLKRRTTMIKLDSEISPDRSAFLSSIPDPRSGDGVSKVDDVDISPILFEALRTVSADHRQCVELHYLKGQSFSEIADQLKIPIGTVKSRLSVAMSKIRDVLMRKGVAVHETAA